MPPAIWKTPTTPSTLTLSDNGWWWQGWQDSLLGYLLIREASFIYSFSILHWISCIWVCGLLLVAWTEGDWEWSCPFCTIFYILFSRSCLLSIHSPLIFLQQLASGILIWGMRCIASSVHLICLCPNLGEPLCSLYIFSLLCVPPFISTMHISDLVLNWFIFFWSSFFCWLSRLYTATNRIPYPYLLALLSLFEWFNCIITPFLVPIIVVILMDFAVSLAANFFILLCSASLVIPFCWFCFLFSHFSIVLWALYQYVCSVCYAFNNYLTTFFDVIACAISIDSLYAYYADQMYTSPS